MHNKVVEEEAAKFKVKNNIRKTIKFLQKRVMSDILRHNRGKILDGNLSEGDVY